MVHLPMGFLSRDLWDRPSGKQGSSSDSLSSLAECEESIPAGIAQFNVLPDALFCVLVERVIAIGSELPRRRMGCRATLAVFYDCFGLQIHEATPPSSGTASLYQGVARTMLCAASLPKVAAA